MLLRWIWFLAMTTSLVVGGLTVLTIGSRIGGDSVFEIVSSAWKDTQNSVETRGARSSTQVINPSLSVMENTHHGRASQALLGHVGEPTSAQSTISGIKPGTMQSRKLNLMTHPSETYEARRTSMTPAVVPSQETATHKDRLRTRLQRSHSRLQNAGNVVHHSEWVPYEATAYSHRCIMPKNGIEGPPQRAANGKWPIANLSVAADPSLPFGTEIEVSHRGKPIRMVVHDRGRAIVGRKLDFFVASCEQAIRWGRKKVYVRILNGD